MSGGAGGQTGVVMSGGAGGQTGVAMSGGSISTDDEGEGGVVAML